MFFAILCPFLALSFSCPIFFVPCIVYAVYRNERCLKKQSGFKLLVWNIIALQLHTPIIDAQLVQISEWQEESTNRKVKNGTAKL